MKRGYADYFPMKHYLSRFSEGAVATLARGGTRGPCVIEVTVTRVSMRRRICSLEGRDGRRVETIDRFERAVASSRRGDVEPATMWRQNWSGHY